MQTALPITTQRFLESAKDSFITNQSEDEWFYKQAYSHESEEDVLEEEDFLKTMQELGSQLELAGRVDEFEAHPDYDRYLLLCSRADQ